MNLPDIYARVCAARPELAVKTLNHYVRTWWYRGDAEGNDTAAALILARWVEALPHNRGIHHGDRGWSISRCDDDGRWNCECIASTPIESLAAFYLGESK